MGSGILDRTKEKFEHAVDNAKQGFKESKEGIKRAFGADGYTRIPTAPEQWVERVKCVGSNNTIDKVVDEAVNSGSSSDKPAQSRAEICNKEIQKNMTVSTNKINNYTINVRQKINPLHL